MQQALQLLKLADRLAHRVMQFLWNAKLARIAGMALHKIQRRVALAVGTPAVGFAALAGALRQRPVQKALGGGDLYDAGTKTALGGGEFGATQPESHVLHS